MTPQLAYDDFGSSASGTPILFMHGLGADRRQTTSAFENKLTGHRLIAPDFPGHGDSTGAADGSDFSFNQFADAAIALLDSLDIQKAHVGGLSMGSGVSLNIALRYPERVEKLILLRPSWLDQCQPPHLKLVADAGHFIQKLGLEEGEKALEALPTYQGLLNANHKVALSINGVFKRPQATNAANVLFKMWESRPFESLASLQTINKEALVLYTTRDDLHPIAVAEAIDTALPNSRSAELPPRYYDSAAYGKALCEKLAIFLT